MIAKSQPLPLLAQRVADEPELVQRVTKGRTTCVQNSHNKFWKAIEEAEPPIESFVRELLEAFLSAAAFRHPVRYDKIALWDWRKRIEDKLTS